MRQLLRRFASIRRCLRLSVLTDIPSRPTSHDAGPLLAPLPAETLSRAESVVRAVGAHAFAATLLPSALPAFAGSHPALQSFRYRATVSQTPATSSPRDSNHI